MPQLPITNGFYENRVRPISSQQCKNWYVHKNQGRGMVPDSLYGTPGLRELTSTGTVNQANRGSHVMAGIAYFVNGEGLWRVNQEFDANGNEFFTNDFLGAIPGEGKVSMSDNGVQLFIMIPGVDGYIFTEDPDTLTLITDPDFKANGNPLGVNFYKGYFILWTDQKRIILSDLNNGLAYNPLAVGTAEADPDAIVGIAISGDVVYILGTETIEALRIDPSAGEFPFSVIQGAGLSVGAIAPFGVIEVFGTFMWIGGATNENPQIFVFEGGRELKISHDGIDFLLESFTETEIANAFSYTYSENGSKFVGWTLPNTTIEFNLTTGLWNERGSYEVRNGSGVETRWRGASVVKAYERILVADLVDGRIGEMDLDIGDEYDNEIIRTVSTLPYTNDGKPLSIPMLELSMENGVGDLNGEFPDPKVSMEASSDGFTYSDKRYASIGRVGQYHQRCQWWGVGWVDRWLNFRFVVSAKVKCSIIKLEADLQ